MLYFITLTMKPLSKCYLALIRIDQIKYIEEVDMNTSKVYLMDGTNFNVIEPVQKIVELINEAGRLSTTPIGASSCEV